MRQSVAGGLPSAGNELRIGIDLGGTKIEGVLMDAQGTEQPRRRMATPRDDYPATLAAIRALVAALKGAGRHLASEAPSFRIGLATPGSLSPRTGLIQNANSTWLNGRALAQDLTTVLGQPVQLANDANCFALSEARDGAGQGTRIVLGVILGTGCGAGVVVDGRLLDGPRGIGGEWGHNPLPWAQGSELPGPNCWCGRRGCMETWVSGPALTQHAQARGIQASRVEDIVAAAARGDARAQQVLDQHADRLARGLAHVVNILDPDVIVLGGGLSHMAHLYERLPTLMAPHIFASDTCITVRPPHWGDSSGVRGAAWL